MIELRKLIITNINKYCEPVVIHPVYLYLDGIEMFIVNSISHIKIY